MTRHKAAGVAERRQVKAALVQRFLELPYFFGTYGGVYGTYRGGSAGDDVRFGANALDMAFVSLMNYGEDLFTLEATTSLLSLVIDFGNHADTFIDNLGTPYAFPVTRLNLP